MSIQLKPGKWKTRDGRVAVVEFKTSRPSAESPWIGYVDQSNWFWSDNGKFWLNEREADLDIIAPYTEPRLRLWKPEEVPVGALLRTARTGQPYRWLIVAVCSDGITTCGGKECVTQSHELIMGTCEHSIDGGKTWLPCGVMEDGE